MNIDNMKLRDAAEAEGRKRYTPSTPCKRGHVSDRWTSTGGCIQCGLRKVVKSNAVRSLLLFRAPVHTSLTPEQRTNLYNYLARCVIAYHDGLGLPAPINPSSLQLGEQRGVPFDEC